MQVESLIAGEVEGGAAMDEKSRLSMCRKIMIDFAGLTGLEPTSRSPRRYLWTDAFAVCNFLELWRKTGEAKYKDLALKLVGQVHQVLGRHRGDDARKGWISGLDEKTGTEHPTRGGLRIGKDLNERPPGERFDEHLEWDRDGQYFHYLTKWMGALNQVTVVTGDFTYNRWAVELAKAACERFVYTTPSGDRYMYWKMSIDLSRPLVPSMGHHDPLDGFITFNRLQALAKKDPEKPAGFDLTGEIAAMAALCEGRDWTTDDALGLGGLLSETYRVAKLVAEGAFHQPGLLLLLINASRAGLESFVGQDPLRYPPAYRLAFRELGLSIGLHAVEKLDRFVKEMKGILGDAKSLGAGIQALMRYVPVGEMIEEFWLDDAHRRSGPWLEHQDINMVMLGTSLLPDTFLSP